MDYPALDRMASSAVLMLTWRYELILHVAVRDINHLRNLGFRFTSQPMVVDVETSVVFDSRGRNELPILLDGAQLTRAPSRSRKARGR
jgi:hypothetical protein